MFRLIVFHYITQLFFVYILLNTCFLYYLVKIVKKRFALKIIELKNKEAVLLEYLDKNSILIKELNHRTKNNFQILLSLMNIQSRKTNNNKVDEFVSVNECRIHAMLATYSQLNQDLKTEVDIRVYMEELVSKLRIAYPLSTTNFKIEIDPILVDSERTKLLGILVVELLTNSIKHNSLKPTILLSIKFENTIYLKLKYSDTGQFNFNTSVLNNTHVSDGLRLIDSIVNHLNGELTIFSNYNYLITIKLDKQSKIYENNKCFNS